MKSRHLLISAVCLYALAVLGTYVGFDQYARNSAESLVDVVLKSEAAALQQGNLISSVTKLQSAIVTSDSLKGVVAYDLSFDPDFKLPLIVLGHVPATATFSNQETSDRLGFFSRVIVRPVSGQKALVFYFDSSFARGSFLLFASILTLFFFVVAFLGMKIEHVRSSERASTFLAVSRQVAHDINSPLSALKISADALARKNVPVDLLKSGIARIEEIVKDLRAEADSRSGLPFSVSQAALEIVNEKKTEYPKYTFHADLATDLYTTGDAAHFRRVLSNLLNNAVEASAPDQPIEVHLARGRRRNVLAVQDHGKGIEPEELKHLFKSGASFGKTGGSGLGLYHAQRTLRAMGGKVEIRSVVNEGTTVSLVCPSAQPF